MYGLAGSSLPVYAEDSATGSPASATPAAPLGFRMTDNTPDSITLEWYKPTTTDITEYYIYTSEKAEGPFAKLGSSKERRYIHKDLAPAVTRFYKVVAVSPNGESPQSTVATGFTFARCVPTPFPVKVATNMCVSLNSTVIADQKPVAGKLTDLVDGSDATSCRFRKACEIKVKLGDAATFADADYLMLHFRTDCGNVPWSNDRNARTLRKYVITESLDSTNGKDGTWTEVATGSNELLDGVIVLPNHKPKWIGVRNLSSENIDPNDKRPLPSDLILARLDVFRSAPAGYRNDYWLFTGDSLVVQDMPASSDPSRKALFSDLIRKQHPDRYPIVVHAARGGEMLKDTLPRTKNVIAAHSPTPPAGVPVGTIVCWETGYNDVGVGGSLGLGGSMVKSYEAAKSLCDSNNLIIVPVRIEFSTQYLDLNTMEPAKYNIFVNTLAANLGGVDVFCRASAPYACNPDTQKPYADYWSYIYQNHATALAKDGVHHTAEGSDGINRIWAETADKMVYSQIK
ncbi:MAG TPA: fibronectin type III domain-containing protein [Candidatus Methylacidiphilales bacterium]|nr:fibronectin type III domain-containing protein [Candidatus Methylacidiphilales bacterium]